MKRKIRTAVIGLGRLGYWHAINISKMTSAELVSICSLTEARVRRIAEELEVPQYTSNPEDIFKDDSIEAVVIATSTESHYQLLKEAIKARKAIFVEKPLTLNLDEAREITELIKENNVFCQVGFMRRFDPAYSEAKNRISAGDIGEPIYFRGISRDPDAPHESFVKTSGGIFVDVAIHEFDIARYLMNAEITAVHAHGKILKNPFMEKYQDIDQSLTYLEFSSGAIGDIEASRNAFYGYDIRAEIVGTEGTILIGNHHHHAVHILTQNGKSHDIMPDFPSRFKEAYELELLSFIDSIRNGNEASVTAEDGLKALEVSLAAKESFQNGVEVKLIN